MRIVVFGASGNTGTQVVRQALDAGHLVTAYVRDPTRLSIAQENLRIFQGDISNAPLVGEAITDQEAVLSTLGAQSPFKYDRVVVEGMSHILRAMESQDVKRLIYLSVAGVNEARRGAGFLIKYIAPWLLRTEVRGHLERENMIRKSSIDWTIVRATTLTNGPHTGEYRTGVNLQSRSFMAKISRADVADFMVNQITSRQYIRQAPRIMY